MPRIAVTGDEVLRHANELADTNQAELATRRIGNGVERADGRETVFLYQTVTIDGHQTTLEQALAGCDTFAGTRPCQINARTRIVVHDVPDSVLAEEHAAAHARTDDDPGPHTNAYDPEKAHVAGAFALMSLGAVGVCAAVCGDGRETGMIVAGVSTLVFGVAWAVFSGARD